MHPYTARKAIAAGMQVRPWCRRCNRLDDVLDLAAIVAEGRGDLNLWDKPFRCRGCGGTRAGLQVTPANVPRIVGWGCSDA